MRTIALNFSGPSRTRDGLDRYELNTRLLDQKQFRAMAYPGGAPLNGRSGYPLLKCNHQETCLLISREPISVTISIQHNVLLFPQSEMYYCRSWAQKWKYQVGFYSQFCFVLTQQAITVQFSQVNNPNSQSKFQSKLQTCSAISFQILAVHLQQGKQWEKFQCF